MPSLGRRRVWTCPNPWLWVLAAHLAVAAATAAYVAPPSGDTRCRPPESAYSPVALVELAGSGAGPAPGAGRLVAGSEESPELVTSLASPLPAARCKAMPSDVLPCVPAGTVVLFFALLLDAIAFRKARSLRCSMKLSLHAPAVDLRAGCLVRAISTHQETVQPKLRSERLLVRPRRITRSLL
jgi:hypothetical protein